jgi:hypothetical protein
VTDAGTPSTDVAVHQTAQVALNHDQYKKIYIYYIYDPKVMVDSW